MKTTILLDTGPLFPYLGRDLNLLVMVLYIYMYNSGQRPQFTCHGVCCQFTYFWIRPKFNCMVFELSTLEA